MSELTPPAEPDLHVGPVPAELPPEAAVEAATPPDTAVGTDGQQSADAPPAVAEAPAVPQTEPPAATSDPADAPTAPDPALLPLTAEPLLPAVEPPADPTNPWMETARLYAKNAADWQQRALASEANFTTLHGHLDEAQLALNVQAARANDAEAKAESIARELMTVRTQAAQSHPIEHIKEAFGRLLESELTKL